LRNPPSVAQQHKIFVNECLTAHLVGYGTNCVPNPLYIDYGIASVSAIPLWVEILSPDVGAFDPNTVGQVISAIEMTAMGERGGFCGGDRDLAKG
jgi:hypothetical protein